MIAFLYALVGCVFSLISLTSSEIDDLPVLSQHSCATCPSVYVPVCTENDMTFTNECRVQCYNDALRKLNKRTLNIAYYGTCVSTFVQVGVQVPDDMKTDEEYDDNSKKY